MRSPRSLFPQLRKLVQEHPRLTIATLRADGVWRGGLRAAVKVRQHRAISMDELRHVGGSDSGPNPEEFERRCPFHYMLKETGASLDCRWEAIRPRRGGRRVFNG